MDKPQKLKNLELKELHDFQEKSEYLISQFGQLYIKKLQLENEEQILKSKYEELTLIETNISHKLKENYGNVQIDLENGNLTYPEK